MWNLKFYFANEISYLLYFSINGDFYLQTNGVTPFARGKEGTSYVDPKELLGNNNTYEITSQVKVEQQ